MNFKTHRKIHDVLADQPVEVDLFRALVEDQRGTDQRESP